MCDPRVTGPGRVPAKDPLGCTPDRLALGYPGRALLGSALGGKGSLEANLLVVIKI